MTTTSSPFNVSLGAGIRVLLIEENAEAASQIHKLLAERSKPTFSMEQVQTVDRALVRLAETGWHVILMDPTISGGSGIEQIRRLDDAASQIPIIVLGSDEDDAAALSAVEMGAQDYLVKHRMDSFLLSRSIQYAIGRKHTEAALTQSEEKYHRIFESIVEGIFQTTPDGHYMSANPALARIYGYDSPEDLMSNITDISKALYVESGRRDEFIRVMEKNDIVSGFESRIHRKDGSIIWISENVRAIRDKRNGLMYYEGTVEDITERKLAEERLRNSEALYHSLVETLPQNIFRKDLSERFTFANRRFCMTLGKPLEDIIGKTDFDFFPAGLAEKYQRDDRVIMETGKTFETVEEHQPPDGGKLFVQVVKTPLYNAQGKIIGLQGIFWDITERKLAEERERLAVQQLAENREELRVKNEELEADLRMACEIQQAMLPQQYPVFPRNVSTEQSLLRFVHYYHPTGTVGGDFFNVFSLSDSTAGIFICDVMGHGVRSALVTAMVRALVEELKPKADDPGRFLSQLNRDLMAILKQSGNMMFTTAFYGTLDVTTRRLRFASAGHPKPLLLSPASGEARQVGGGESKGGPALGIFEESEYRTFETRFENRDKLLLFTDGLFEVENREGKLLDYDDLMELAKSRSSLSVDKLLPELVEAVRSFGATSSFQDDVCVVAVEANLSGQGD